MRDKIIHNLKYPIRIKVFDEDTTHDIKDYEITSAKDNKFVSDFKDMEFCTKDMEYIILYPEVFETIIDDIYNKGFEDGKCYKNKKKIEETITIE